MDARVAPGHDESMPIHLDASAADFAHRSEAFPSTKREASTDAEAAVRAIIADVVGRGDRALVELTRKFDGFDPEEIGLKVAPDEIARAAASCDRAALDALAFARD